jgi:phosphatidylserine decarboxylase
VWLRRCQKFWVKGKDFTLEKLFDSKERAADFAGGCIAICRLAPQDYHRFHAPVDGKFKKETTLLECSPY